MFPHMTSSISCDVIFCHKTLQDVIVALVLNFLKNWLVKFRNTDFLVQTGGKFLKLDLDIQTYAKYIFLKSDCHANYEIYFVFK